MNKKGRSMLSNSERKMISALAKRLEITYKRVYDFYREICLRVEPPLSVQAFVSLFGQYQNPNPSISEFVDFTLSRQKSRQRRGHADMEQNSITSPPLSSSTRDALTIREMDWNHKAKTTRHLLPTIPLKPKEPYINKGLQRKVAALLPGEDNNDLDAAKLFLLDMRRIRPQYTEHLDLFLAAVKRCARRNQLTVDEVWETMWKIRNPQLEKPQIISIPMGGKK
jgi:hypothetical protein